MLKKKQKEAENGKMIKKHKQDELKIQKNHSCAARAENICKNRWKTDFEVKIQIFQIA